MIPIIYHKDFSKNKSKILQYVENRHKTLYNTPSNDLKRSNYVEYHYMGLLMISFIIINHNNTLASVMDNVAT